MRKQVIGDCYDILHLKKEVMQVHSLKYARTFLFHCIKGLKI